MGSRFGRNRRRQARNEVATLRYSVGQARQGYDRALEHARRLEADVRVWEDDLEFLVGPHGSARRKVNATRVRRLEDFNYKGVPSRTDDRGPALRTYNMSAETVRMERMHRFMVRVERQRARQQTYMRFTLVDDGERWAYCVSDSQIRKRGLGPRDVEELGREIARQLCHAANIDFRGPRAA